MENKSFEELMKQLEQLVESLEKGETKLEEALALYKEGIGIIETLGKRLDDAKKQIQTVGNSTKEDETNG